MTRVVRSKASEEAYRRSQYELWFGYWRCNPHRFAIEYLGMTWLKMFQCILLNIILRFNYAMIIASRGFGKTMLVAAAICIKCILYPGTQVVVTSGARGQAVNVLKKIVEVFVPNSDNLRGEIRDWNLTTAGAHIIFWNGSTVNVATANEKARSERATWLVVDEFVQVKKLILDGVLRKFKAGSRHPGFMDLPEYKDYPLEPNRETYISSAYFKHHWSWGKFKSFFESMKKGEPYCVLGFPYQLPIEAGYYRREQVIEEMQESDFNPITWSMQMESLFFGESENAWYSHQELEDVRRIRYAMYPADAYAQVKYNKMRPIPKQTGELRIVSCDIAVMGGSKNDNSCYAVMQLLPVKRGGYIRNVMYIETCNGEHTVAQALRIRKLFQDFEGDYIVLDTQGAGIGVFDTLCRELVDDESGEIYPPVSCANDPVMASRCRDRNAPKVIYSIRANAQFNSDAALAFRDHIKRGLIRLLIDEEDAQEMFANDTAFMRLTTEEQSRVLLPYVQTSLFITETINLSYDILNGKVRIKETGTRRKDRYSSIMYADVVASELEKKYRRRYEEDAVSGDGDIPFVFRQPNLYGR